MKQSIFGLGVDILEISRIELLNSQRLANKILTKNELLEFQIHKKPHLFLAKKFSSKEAVAKAFGVGIGAKLSFKDIEITHSHTGKPLCDVNQKKYFEITNGRAVIVHISISDTKSLVQVHCLVELINS